TSQDSYSVRRRPEAVGRHRGAGGGVAGRRSTRGQGAGRSHADQERPTPLDGADPCPACGLGAEELPGRGAGPRQLGGAEAVQRVDELAIAATREAQLLRLGIVLRVAMHSLDERPGAYSRSRVTVKTCRVMRAGRRSRPI